MNERRNFFKLAALGCLTILGVDKTKVIAKPMKMNDTKRHPLNIDSIRRSGDYSHCVTGIDEPFIQST